MLLNKASVRVLEKAGFQCKGILRAKAFKDGQVLDQYRHSCVVKKRKAIIGILEQQSEIFEGSDASPS